jgi:phosphoethanolamine N-methyltransferase
MTTGTYYTKDMQYVLQLVWGEGFLSPGGNEEVDDIFNGESLQGLCGLDVGCGLGAVDKFLLQNYKVKHITAIDFEHDAIQTLQQQNIQGLTPLVVVPGPFPFPNDHFDFVFCKDALVMSPDRDLVISEMIRVLKPEGRLIITDYVQATSPSKLLELFYDADGQKYNTTTLDDMIGVLKN